MGTSHEGHKSPPLAEFETNEADTRRGIDSMQQRPPRAPDPSKDPGIATTHASTTHDEMDFTDFIAKEGPVDIFSIPAIIALKLMCRSIDHLAQMTGDVPPTPPVSSPANPTITIVQVEPPSPRKRGDSEGRRSTPTGSPIHEDDGRPFVKTPIGSPESGSAEPLLVIGADIEPMAVQQGAITRKFYSKRPPPISLEEYLSRLHKYCPMSTAVYLATSLYIHKAALIDRVIPVTRRNVHRLLLGGLRIGMKALEDLNYPASRFAKVGGVTERELARLEISFCFLTSFELRVTEDMLSAQAITLRDTAALRSRPDFELKLPLMREKHKGLSSLVGKA
ncbi:MAG: hypothetical protein M1824_003761 [Vezdaea acicularis]|nr:MAG: hypothetical protein M1824_003761 [Vezdaea acicularis]